MRSNNDDDDYHSTQTYLCRVTRHSEVVVVRRFNVMIVGSRHRMCRSDKSFTTRQHTGAAVGTGRRRRKQVPAWSPGNARRTYGHALERVTERRTLLAGRRADSRRLI